MRLEPRLAPSLLVTLGYPALAIFAAMAFGAALVALGGANPLSVFALVVLAALALVPLATLARLGAGEARPRFVAGNGASPDDPTLTSSAGAATNRGVRFEALAQASS